MKITSQSCILAEKKSFTHCTTIKCVAEASAEQTNEQASERHKNKILFFINALVKSNQLTGIERAHVTSSTSTTVPRYACAFMGRLIVTGGI